MRLVIFGAFILFALTAAPAEEIAQIKKLGGEVHIVREGAKLPARPGDRLETLDTIKTGSDGNVGLTFIDGSRFALGPKSTINLSRFRFNPTTQEGEFQTRLKRGSLGVISGKIAKQSPDAMTVRTRTRVLGVRGTKFLVRIGK